MFKQNIYIYMYIYISTHPMQSHSGLQYPGHWATKTFGINKHRVMFVFFFDATLRILENNGLLWGFSKLQTCFEPYGRSQDSLGRQKNIRKNWLLKPSNSTVLTRQKHLNLDLLVCLATMLGRSKTYIIPNGGE